VTFEPGSITKPARSEYMVSWVFEVKPPRNCTYTADMMSRKTTRKATPTHL
jgi:hypothetical protein